MQNTVFLFMHYSSRYLHWKGNHKAASSGIGGVQLCLHQSRGIIQLIMDMRIIKLVLFFLLLLPASTIAQNSAGVQKAPAVPTHIDVKERTIKDLLYFRMTFSSAPRPKRISSTTIWSKTSKMRESRSQKTIYMVVCQTERNLYQSSNG